MDDKTYQVGIEPIGSDVTEGEGRKGTVSRSLLQIQSEKASRRELEKVSRCRLQFDLISPGTILGFGARLARERSRFIVPSAGTSKDTFGQSLLRCERGWAPRSHSG